MKILLLSILLIFSSSLYARNDNETTVTTKETKSEMNFDYLKFNVYDFMKKDSITELPDDKLKYLKFDVNKYIKEDKENN